MGDLLRLWRNLATIRRQKMTTLLLFRIPGLTRLLKRPEISPDDLKVWEKTLSEVYHCLEGRYRELQEQHNDRELSMIPQSLRTAELEGIWYSDIGRWQSIRDASSFCQMVGAPELRNNLLASNVCFEFGYMGHADLNGMPYVSLAEFPESGWRCVTTVTSVLGTMFGFAPHTLRMQEEPDGGNEHIDARIAVLPRLYTPRVAVVALKYVAARETLRVQVKGKADTHSQRHGGQHGKGQVVDGGTRSEQLNRSIQSLPRNPPETRYEGSQGQDVAIPMRRLARSMLSLARDASQDDSIAEKLSEAQSGDGYNARARSRMPRESAVGETW
ncbi:hypothetical protein PRZ48_004271 [Zasmidium cellare]|uniref:Uncharacterized protein n=1 Tax=Zasmidium cellare TaxID=395010 RepID=A0ABR0EP22_ZASCE|nr:hypothetical protein PRZ48_004271 [Zasmidium cellare]